MGVEGWGWSDVAPHFGELEAELRISRKPRTRFCDTSIAAAEQAGFAEKDDFNDGELSGFLGYEWMNLEGNSRRNGYVACLLPRLAQGNVQLVTNALCHRVLFDEARRAVGVEYEVNGARTTVRATREVILCAGALETPKLLQLSGIGPKALLRAHGIEPLVELPAVGENLHDHPNVQLFSLGREPSDSTWAQLYGFHRARPEAPLPAGEADSCYVFYSARSSLREGMIRLLPGMILPPALYRKRWLRQAIRSAVSAGFRMPGVTRFVSRVWGIVVILGKPQSRGTVRIVSSRAADLPAVDPNYFAAESDLEVLVDGVKLARRIGAAAPLAAWGNRELMPGRRVRTDEALRRFIRKNAITTYHFAGTCRMSSTGREPEAVVDSSLRVRGVEGLRVADASVIPWTPVSAMNAPSMLVGYRAALLLAAARRPRS
jgi:choline dehydrogenase